jgi:molybdopterin converting factor small subunit
VEQAASVEVAADSVGEALNQLVEDHPGIKASLFDEAGGINPFVRVFVGERDIADLEGTATRVSDGTVVSLICPIAGG